MFVITARNKSCTNLDETYHRDRLQSGVIHVYFLMNVVFS